MNTIAYYNTNAQAFYDRTIGTDMSLMYEKFLNFLPDNAHILDAGCGVGRDSKFFLKVGYEVTAFDASAEMVKYSTKELEKPILQLRFQDLNFEEKFEGVWANASLIHIPYKETKDVYARIHKALKPRGIFYGSYKYGKEHMSVSGREFYNMTEASILPYLKDLFEVIEISQTEDTRSQVAPSPDKAWLNFIVKKRG